ncbi:hypothetical protein LNQ03_31105 [Klebsiella pneumoniae subsp. pneumoniae]|nr:hypothetical protein [Klebsiella pneumoniae subsp. pneumoniae]
MLAQGGVKQIIELQLAGEEQAKFSQSIAVIRGQYRPSALTAARESVRQ